MNSLAKITREISLSILGKPGTMVECMRTSKYHPKLIKGNIFEVASASSALLTLRDCDFELHPSFFRKI